ncbi:DEAD/DEAH box helicase [Citromicrobium bathyomarinum]|uniref:DEAD/DEAH box helicase n=1 Tax=Citromicrobium TaxID=72173 RepID=UPI0001DD0BA9|nr:MULTISPECIES: DEAD/DEAH box helicase [Citromicrobium]MAY78259.1 ATP-dependent helicase [Citromicrobium sp.]ALG61451.1 DEAD/DEAH box helicase [Citromicrobium sp. JL477]KPM14402.1 DEAD/DEAH box helicase [Citromicrobium sp. JL1351]KPM20882.1 DEAD/DEAH box helicase [Citromicrobium sp. JL31]KPM25177.1 DEAD/DEAH box helicase [Citromicrobium sp. RCC1885]|tara:strand:- start:1581 stop:3341 length:1761 start_codon:yes stop_codon:yes gene_type:complete
MNFSELPDTLQTALTERGYSEPTDVQAAVLEPEARGRDLVVSAQTGSGKTVAFGLAVARQLLDENGKVPFAVAPLALVIAPTRELALQVSRELSWLYAKAGGRVATCVGGMNPSAERKALRSGATIVVGTPGRLRDHLERGALDLSALKAVTLDEADEMLDMGFREELETILDATPEGRRTLLFSATMPKPIEALARRYQNNALRISTVSADRGHGDISYEAVVVSPPEVENAVVNLLRYHEAETAILFCGTREKVRHMHATLQERGFAVVSLSGENSQSERNQALQALRDRRARVCVATDVAARGIDLPTLSLVVHVEIPRDAETLQHRSGRTGRAGRKGTAVLVVPFSRRRRVEQMLRNAKIDAKWTDAPDREAIRAKDRDRLMQTLLTAVEPDEGDTELVDALLAQRTPRELAAMLVASHRAKMPEPEDLIANTPEARRAAQAEKHRPGFEDTVWFKMDIGRRRNADPRWILPLLCRRGHITRNEVGAIRIGPDETFFQIPRAIADKFSAAVARTADDGADGDDIRIEASAEAPRDAARANRKGPPQGRHNGKPKPHRKNNDAGARPGPKGKGAPKKARPRDR